MLHRAIPLVILTILMKWLLKASTRSFLSDINLSPANSLILFCLRQLWFVEKVWINLEKLSWFYTFCSVNMKTKDVCEDVHSKTSFKKVFFFKTLFASFLEKELYLDPDIYTVHDFVLSKKKLLKWSNLYKFWLLTSLFRFHIA